MQTPRELFLTGVEEQGLAVCGTAQNPVFNFVMPEGETGCPAFFYEEFSEAAGFRRAAPVSAAECFFVLFPDAREGFVQSPVEVFPLPVAKGYGKVLFCIDP